MFIREEIDQNKHKPNKKVYQNTQHYLPYLPPYIFNVKDPSFTNYVDFYLYLY